MTHDTLKPTRILAVIDPDGGPVALESARALADRHGATLEVMACVEPPHDLAILSRLSGQDPDALIAEAVAKTRAAVSDRLADALPGQAIEPQVAVGKAYLEIIRHVARSGCDFVIKAAEPLSGMTRFLFASTDQHLLRKCPCPVWLQTAGAPLAPTRVLAAVDLDIWDADEPETLAALNRRVVAAARAVAAAPEAEITVVHAWEAIGEGMLWAFSGGADAGLAADRYVNEIIQTRQTAMNQFLSNLPTPAANGPRLVPQLARGVPEVVIHDQCRAIGADLVVMGTVARTGLSGVFIGNTAENIINSLECPVLAVKPDRFVSPLLAQSEVGRT